MGKTIEILTDDTSLEDVCRLGLLSVRATNVLCRAGYKTIGAIRDKTEEELVKLRNAGIQMMRDTMAFIDAYNKCHNDSPSENLISADKLIAYCQKCADVSQGIADKVLDNIGHGESEQSAFGACAFFSIQAKMYRYDIPDVIRAFMDGGKDDG